MLVSTSLPSTSFPARHSRRAQNALSRPTCRRRGHVHVSAAVSGRPTTTTVVSTVPVVVVNYRVSLFDALRFNGPAPELINGRLAMLGFILAAGHEAETGETMLFQLSHLSVGNCLLVALWVYASMVPVLAGAKNEAFGFFTPRAEITNGRAAMLGFAALIALEWQAGVSFF